MARPVLLLAFVAAMVLAQDAPQQIRLAFGGGVDMVVSWTTIANTSDTTVKYGTTSGSYSFVATGTTSNYSTDVVFHDVVLPNLSPATTYYYICGSLSGGWSSEFSFVSNSLTADAFTIAVYGDMGISNSEATNARLIEQLNNYNFVMHVGDFGYADDRITGFEEVWNQFQAQIEPIAATKAYMVCPGNHEASCHSPGDFLCEPGLSHLNFTAYNHRFRMPWKESGASGLNMWHSFNYGSAHFIMIDTETDIGPNSPEGPGTLWNSGGFGDQLAWLAADLKAAVLNRAQRPWIIVSGHRPMYSTASDATTSIVWPNATLHLRQEVEQMFYTYGVDFYFCGHVHAYERMWPVYQNQTVQRNYTNPPVLTHLTVGGAGNIEGGEAWGPETDWLATRENEYGFGMLSIQNASVASWQYIRASDGAVLDSIVLERKRS